MSAGAGLMCRHVLRTPALLSQDVSHDGVRRLHRNFWGAAIACYGVSAVFFLATSDFRALGKATVD